MTGGLSFLAVGLLVGAAIAWVLPGLPQLMPVAPAPPRAEKPAGEPDPGAGPKNDQPSLVELDADEAARVRDDGAGNDDPTGYGTATDLFESKGFGASFGGLVSVVTFQIAGVNALSTFAITLLIVVGYWLAFDKPR